MQIDKTYRSRKFLLAVFFTVAGTLLAVYDNLTGEYLGLVSVVLGLYGVANVAMKKVGNDIQ